ncbi:F-box/kelch-repeat protein At3g23880-like [Apium graveolens]|uniref:F-box/kelch-repeat protein At3g23880-like n=1 Tax=Apium graveolens TaxID=4045 RepID=UPI003D796D7B
MAVKRCRNLSFLPSELIESEILPRLPVKSVLRFKSVCKSWNFLISSNPDFIKSHLHLNPNNDSLVLKTGDKKKYFHCNDSLLQCYTDIIGSVNGLVCFYNWHFEYEGFEIAIWNPATKQCLTNIPNLPDRYEDRELERDDCFGFGFDSVANDFKVIYVVTIEDQPLVGQIYSCNQYRCWRKITPSKFLFRGSGPILLPPVIFRGSPYWLYTQPNGKNSSLIVIWFDIHNEIFQMLPEVGSVDKKQGKTSNVINFKDSIAVLVYDYVLFLSASVDVYVLNDRHCGWTKFSIGPIIVKEATSIWRGQRLFQCFKNDDVLFVSSSNELCSANLQSHAIKSMGKEGKSCSIVSCCAFSESLIFIQGMKHFDEKEDEVGIFFLKKA